MRQAEARDTRFVRRRTCLILCPWDRQRHVTHASSGDVSDFVRVESRCDQRESLVQDDSRQAPDSVGCPQVDGKRVARPRPELRAARPAPVAQVPDGAGEHLLHLLTYVICPQSHRFCIAKVNTSSTSPHNSHLSAVTQIVHWKGEHILRLSTYQRESGSWTPPLPFDTSTWTGQVNTSCTCPHNSYLSAVTYTVHCKGKHLLYLSTNQRELGRWTPLPVDKSTWIGLMNTSTVDKSTWTG